MDVEIISSEQFPVGMKLNIVIKEEKREYMCFCNNLLEGLKKMSDHFRKYKGMFLMDIHEKMDTENSYAELRMYSCMCNVSENQYALKRLSGENIKDIIMNQQSNISGYGDVHSWPSDWYKRSSKKDDS